MARNSIHTIYRHESFGAKYCGVLAFARQACTWATRQRVCRTDAYPNYIFTMACRSERERENLMFNMRLPLANPTPNECSPTACRSEFNYIIYNMCCGVQEWLCRQSKGRSRPRRRWSCQHQLTVLSLLKSTKVNAAVAPAPAPAPAPPPLHSHPHASQADAASTETDAR